MTEDAEWAAQEQAQLARLQSLVRPLLPRSVVETVEYLGDRDDQDGEVWQVNWTHPAETGLSFIVFVMSSYPPDWFWSWHLSQPPAGWHAGDPEGDEVTEARIVELLGALASGTLTVRTLRFGRLAIGNDIAIVGKTGESVYLANRQSLVGRLMKVAGLARETVTTYRNWQSVPS